MYRFLLLFKICVVLRFVSCFGVFFALMLDELDAEAAFGSAAGTIFNLREAVGDQEIRHAAGGAPLDSARESDIDSGLPPALHKQRLLQAASNLLRRELHEPLGHGRVGAEFRDAADATIFGALAVNVTTKLCNHQNSAIRVAGILLCVSWRRLSRVLWVLGVSIKRRFLAPPR